MAIRQFSGDVVASQTMAAPEGAHIIQQGNQLTPALPAAVIQQMMTTAALLQMDMGAVWAFAATQSGGSLLVQSIVAAAPVAALAAAVGGSAFAGMTAIDKFFDGAISNAVADLAIDISHLDTSVVLDYFGDGNAFNEPAMMSQICSNWEDYWEDMPQIVAPIQHQLG
jgi:hypothetical protein